MHGEKPVDQDSACEAALALLAASTSQEWQGLPPGCSIDDLTRRFGAPLGGQARAAG